jgi:hypothetical protein
MYFGLCPFGSLDLYCRLTLTFGKQEQEINKVMTIAGNMFTKEKRRSGYKRRSGLPKSGLILKRAPADVCAVEPLGPIDPVNHCIGRLAGLG